MIKDWVRMERRRRGWSQKDLAQRAGVAQAHISKIELGQRTKPSMDVIQGLARAFEMSVADFLFAVGEEEQPGSVGAALGRLQSIWERLPPSEQATLLHVAESLECYQTIAHRDKDD